jgi:hypothetical protein
MIDGDATRLPQIFIVHKQVVNLPGTGKKQACYFLESK